MPNDQYKWITYYNPRNGQIRIKACEKCGIARGLQLAEKSCRQTMSSENKMKSAGWQTVPAAAQ